MPRAPRHAHPDHNDPTTWLRRGEVGKLLGVPRTSVRYLESNGALHPIRDRYGDYLYDPDEVHAYAMNHPRRGAKIYDDGDLTCEAFKMFEEGKTRVQVVIALRVTCDKVDALWTEWRSGDFETAVKARHQAQLRARLEQAQQAHDQKRQRSLEALKKLQAKLTRG